MCQSSPITEKAEPRYLVYTTYTRGDAVVSKALLCVSSITCSLIGYSLILDGGITSTVFTYIVVGSFVFYSATQMMAMSWEPKTKTQEVFGFFVMLCLISGLYYLDGVAYTCLRRYTDWRL